MFINFLKIALRNLVRQRFYSAINIVGLAVGMSGFLLIFLFIADELGYDRYHPEADRIYRLTCEMVKEGIHSAQVSAPVGPAIVQEYPVVQKAVRFYPAGRDILLKRGDRSFYENDLYFADPNVFEIFSFPLLRGDPATALQEPQTIVLSEDTAKKYFGGQDPVGEILSFENRADFRVTGVMANVRRNTHLHPGFLASFASLAKIAPPSFVTGWGEMHFFTYVLLKPGASAAAMEQRLPEFEKKHYPARTGSFAFHLQPVTDIHLKSHLMYEAEPNGDIKYVNIFGLTAALILMIACVNFMNLSIARSSTRLREAGIRKVLGGWRGDLLRQFQGEAFVFVLLALLIAFVLAALLLPLFNSVSGKALSLGSVGTWTLAALFFGVLTVSGLLSGLYPAVVLSAMNPMEALKGRLAKGRWSASAFRTGLVIFQFFVSAILIASTLVIVRQMRFIAASRLGLDKEHLLIIDGGRFSKLSRDFGTIKTELLGLPGVRSVAASSSIPAGPISRATVFPGADIGKAVAISNQAVSPEYIETFGMAVASGRNFSRELSTDEKEAVIINETAARQFGWDNPIGKEFTVYLRPPVKGSVVGLVKDFHFDSLHAEIEPLVLYIRPQYYRFLSVRIRPDNILRTLSHLEKIWRAFDPSRPFEYAFFDDRVDRLYKNDRKLASIFLYFAVLSIGLACLGLFGLASFTVHRRTREMGLRKVLGATTGGIVGLISGQFMKWIAAANLLAWPATYYLMSRWLRGFAYRVGIGIWIFPAAAFLTLAIAFGTVAGQALRAAGTDPAAALRQD